VGREEPMKKEELLDLLPPIQKRIVDLYVYEEKSVEQIEEITGISTKYIEQELEEAFHILKERIIHEKEKD
jgi:DNA-directed RNA polymerase specialized sigma24 family protein